jgi:hypothetical protein
MAVSTSQRSDRDANLQTFHAICHHEVEHPHAHRETIRREGPATATSELCEPRNMDPVVSFLALWPLIIASYIRQKCGRSPCTEEE